MGWIIRVLFRKESIDQELFIFWKIMVLGSLRYIGNKNYFENAYVEQ